MRSPERESIKEQPVETPKAFSDQNFYERLKISPESSQEDISRAFRGLSKEYHPDKRGGEEDAGEFQELSEAYTTLKNPELRKKYDARLAEKLPQKEHGLEKREEKGKGPERNPTNQQIAEKEREGELRRLEELKKELVDAEKRGELAKKEREVPRKEVEDSSPESAKKNMEKVRKILGGLYNLLPHDKFISPFRARKIIGQSPLDEYLSENSPKRKSTEWKLAFEISLLRLNALDRSEFIDFCVKQLRKDGAIEEGGHRLEVTRVGAQTENISREKTSEKQPEKTEDALLRLTQKDVEDDGIKKAA